jgi:hypothetical protein
MPDVVRQRRVEQLQFGATVEYRETGNSMEPRIHSRQLLRVEPVQKLRPPLRVGDIVFARVRGQFYTHLFAALVPGRVLIQNNHGHTNGWTTLKHVYGVVTHIDGVACR